MRAVLVHEWLTNVAGSEKVVAALRRVFPGAPVVSSMCWRPAFPDWDPVLTSFLQPLATGPGAHVKALPAMPVAFRSLRLPDADVVLTSFHTFALHARVPPTTPHLVYCHAPPRFIWSPEQLAAERLPGRRWLISAAATALKRLDVARASRPTAMVANSFAVAGRIRFAYGREAPVVHPPVDVERFASALHAPTRDYFLVVSRLVPYKRVDLAIAAFAELGWPLLVAGSGRSAAALEAAAPSNVRFLGHVGDADLPALLAGARALVFPGEEDFGITPVEAMAAGTPVVAFGRGGALETVVEGLSGVFFHEPSPQSLALAVRLADRTEWDRAAVSASVRRYNEQRFATEIRAAVVNLVA